jgi:hypothetical protein
MKKYMLILCLAFCVFANTKTRTWSGREFQIKMHDINQVEMCISNFGKFGQTATGNAGCWWPKGSGQNYIYGAGLWFGTIDSMTGDTLVTIGYGPHGGETEVVPGLKDMSPNHPDNIIYMYPTNWPPPIWTFPMAPQRARSHQDSWTCFNDCDSSAHVPGDTRPIDLEIYQTVYAWDEPAIEDKLFMIYEIKNVSGHDLYDCYVGICTDCDIGNEAGIGDDQCTAILRKPYFIDGSLYLIDNLAYQWDGDDYEPGWSSVGAIGFDLLQTPFDLQPGQDKDNDGILDEYERDSAYYWNNVPTNKWDVDNDGMPDWRDASENPQLEMTAFKIFTLNLEPNIDPARYATLAGYNWQTGQYEPYDTIIPTPDDQRFLLSSGPFDLDADSIITVVFATVLADFGLDATPPAETCLVINDHWAQWQYDMNWFLTVEEETSFEILNTNLIVSPNPAYRSAKVKFSIPKSGSVSIKLYNAAGQLVRTITQGYERPGTYTLDINSAGLAQGTYFLVLETPGGKSSRSFVILR